MPTTLILVGGLEEHTLAQTGALRGREPAMLRPQGGRLQRCPLPARNRGPSDGPLVCFGSRAEVACCWIGWACCWIGWACECRVRWGGGVCFSGSRCAGGQERAGAGHLRSCPEAYPGFCPCDIRRRASGIPGGRGSGGGGQYREFGQGKGIAGDSSLEVGGGWWRPHVPRASVIRGAVLGLGLCCGHLKILNNFEGGAFSSTGWQAGAAWNSVCKNFGPVLPPGRSQQRIVQERWTAVEEDAGGQALMLQVAAKLPRSVPFNLRPRATFRFS